MNFIFVLRGSFNRMAALGRAILLVITLLGMAAAPYVTF